VCQEGDAVGSNAVHVVYYASLAGRARAGTILSDWQPVDVGVLCTTNRYLVLELDEHGRVPGRLSQVPQRFSCVATFAGDPRLRQRDLVIYERTRDVQASGTSAGVQR
jgi:hypothetical protein